MSCYPKLHCVTRVSSPGDSGKDVASAEYCVRLAELLQCRLVMTGAAGFVRLAVCAVVAAAICGVHVRAGDSVRVTGAEAEIEGGEDMTGATHRPFHAIAHL